MLGLDEVVKERPYDLIMGLVFREEEILSERTQGEGSHLQVMNRIQVSWHLDLGLSASRTET